MTNFANLTLDTSTSRQHECPRGSPLLRQSNLTLLDELFLTSRVPIPQGTNIQYDTCYDTFDTTAHNNINHSPDINDEETNPPNHTIFIEACLKRKKRDLSPSLADFIKTNLGDNDIRVTSPTHPTPRSILFFDSSLALCS